MSKASKGKKKSDSMRKKLSLSTRGKPKYWLRGVPLKDETKRKMSLAHKGLRKGVKLSRDTIAKQILYRTGCHWYNNGVTERFSKECPEGFVLGRLQKSKGGRQ
jgi:hypothetical protein